MGARPFVVRPARLGLLLGRSDLAVRDLLGHGCQLVDDRVPVRRSGADLTEADAVVREREEGVLTTDELPVVDVLHHLEDAEVDLLQRTRQDVRAEERLIGVDADAPDALLFAAARAPRPQLPAAWKTAPDPAAIWLSAISLHFAWSTKSSE